MSIEEKPEDPYFFHSTSLKEFAPAFIKAQREMGAAHKGANNPFFKSKYADLGEVVATVKDPLNNNGIGFLQFPVSGGHGANVITMLLHESGEFVGGMFDTPASKNDAQGFGSAITYGRRYTLQAACGVPAVDDDGNAASGKGATNYDDGILQDFPPYKDNEGLLVGINPPEGDKPAQAAFQLACFGQGMPYHFDIIGDHEQYKPLIGREVIYHYTKKGSYRPIKYIKLKPIEVKKEVAKPLPKTEPKPMGKVSTEAPNYLRGTVESVKVKQGKKGEFAILAIGDEGGSKMEVFCHKTTESCGVTDFKELEDQEVCFVVEESQSNGKTYINIKDLWLADMFEQAMAEK